VLWSDLFSCNYVMSTACKIPKNLTLALVSWCKLVLTTNINNVDMKVNLFASDLYSAFKFIVFCTDFQEDSTFVFVE
jgi:hypothetical protein